MHSCGKLPACALRAQHNPLEYFKTLASKAIESKVTAVTATCPRNAKKRSTRLMNHTT